jgi:hypothetical protein
MNDSEKLILAQQVIMALNAYLNVKKSWDNNLTELVVLKALLKRYNETT